MWLYVIPFTSCLSSGHQSQVPQTGTSQFGRPEARAQGGSQFGFREGHFLACSLLSPHTGREGALVSFPHQGTNPIRPAMASSNPLAAHSFPLARASTQECSGTHTVTRSTLTVRQVRVVPSLLSCARCRPCVLLPTAHLGIGCHLAGHLHCGGHSGSQQERLPEHPAGSDLCFFTGPIMSEPRTPEPALNVQGDSSTGTRDEDAADGTQHSQRMLSFSDALLSIIATVMVCVGAPPGSEPTPARATPMGPQPHPSRQPSRRAWPVSAASWAPQPLWQLEGVGEQPGTGLSPQHHGIQGAGSAQPKTCPSVPFVSLLVDPACDPHGDLPRTGT